METVKQPKPFVPAIKPKYNELILAIHKYEKTHNLRRIDIRTDYVLITCCTHTYRLTWEEIAGYL